MTRRTSLAIVVACVSATIAVALYGTAHHMRSSAETPIERRVAALLSGIPQHGNALGYPTAPVTLQVFGDLECASVKEWFEGRLPTILRQFVRTKILRVEYLAMKTDTINPQTFVSQQSAAIAAGLQSRMWEFLITFYEEQGQEYTNYVTESFLNRIAQQVSGFDAVTWHKDRVDVPAGDVIASNRAARRSGLHDTPAFRIGRTDGPMHKLTGRRAAVYQGFTYRMHADGTTSLIPIPGHHMHPLYMIDARDIEKAIEKLKQ